MTAKTARSAAKPSSPPRWNVLPQYGQRGPLSKEIRAQ
jgi:hypothetical protein